MNNRKRPKSKLSAVGQNFLSDMTWKRISWPNGQLLPIHTIHILKAIVPTINLAYPGTLYVHPVIRPIFVTFWDWTGSISWNLVICWFPRKMSFSRTASSIQIWTKRNSSKQRQKEATFVSSVQCSMEVFKQLVNQDKSCICDIILYVQTKYFVHFQTFWQPPLARVGNICHPGLLKIIKLGTKASFWSATTGLSLLLIPRHLAVFGLWLFLSEELFPAHGLWLLSSGCFGAAFVLSSFSPFDSVIWDILLLWRLRPLWRLHFLLIAL